MAELPIDFANEAKQVLNEVSYAIAEGAVSRKLQSTAMCAYINLTTKEEKAVTVRLCGRGFEVHVIHRACLEWRGDNVTEQLESFS